VSGGKTSSSPRGRSPASAGGLATLPELQRWDSFYLLVLTADEEAHLDALWGDSYFGDWA